MSNLAIGLALGASVGANNSSNSDAKKTYYCNQIMPTFNPKTATVKDKQNYASCVDHFYPAMSPTDIIAMKVIIVLTFMSCLFGLRVAYKNKEWIEAVLFGVGFPFLTFFGLLLLYAGVSFVFGM